MVKTTMQDVAKIRKQEETPLLQRTPPHIKSQSQDLNSSLEAQILALRPKSQPRGQNLASKPKS